MTLAQPLKHDHSTMINQSTCAYGAYWCVGCGVDISLVTTITDTPDHPVNHSRLVYPVRVQSGEVQLFI